MSDEIDVAGAARILGVNSARVRKLLADGALDGRRVGARWLLSASSVHARAAEAHPRPYSERSAWALLLTLAGDSSIPVSRSESARIKERVCESPVRLSLLCRRRASVHRLLCPPSQLGPILSHRGSVRSGVSAVADYGLDLMAIGQGEIYVRDEAELRRLSEDHALRPSAEDPNLIVRVPSRWVFGEDPIAPLPIVALDLIESKDPRSVLEGSAVIAKLAKLRLVELSQ